MQDGLRELLERRRNRALAGILGFKDSSCAAYLPTQVNAGLRKVVLDQLNEYHNVVLDVLESLLDSNGVALNDIYLSKIDELHDGMERLVASLEVS